MEELFREFFSDYGWIAITTFLLFFFKNMIENLYYGMRFLLGNEFNVDDIVHLNNKKCRIVRQSILKTTFYIIDENRKFHIENGRLHYYIIEKELKCK